MDYRRQSDKKVSVALALLMLTLAFAAGTRTAHAQTPTVLYNFQNTTTDICMPSGAMAQGRDGNVYGAGRSCGANNTGGVFKISPAGVESVVVSFPSGWSACSAGLTLGSDGNFYGACEIGNPATGLGSLYKVTPTGVFTDLHDFTGASGDAYPQYAPTQASDGNFYGTTGLLNATCGNIYKMTLAGVESNFHTFSGDCIPSSGVIQASDGSLYGTISNCPLTGNRGCAYKITTAGVFTDFYGFVDATGWAPSSGLIQGKDGKFYGTTQLGGATGTGGTIYKLTTAGAITVLHNINTPTDGSLLSILQATDSNFYGAGFGGGNANQGSTYKLTLAGVFTPFSLDGTTTGAGPSSPMIQDTNGLVYGTAVSGGNGGVGTFFSLSTGSVAFANLGSLSGKIGSKVGIFGQGFTTASVVKFGGVQATAVTRTGTTYLTATVPAAALTGAVTVTTAATTLTSAQTYKVKPTLLSFNPTSGPVGTPVTITGTAFTQTTKVTFNKTAATFTVNSDTQITATVPAGATTGKIAVTTKGGTATSATSFTVN